MSASTSLLTADDLWNRHSDEPKRELIDGELQSMMSPSGAAHGLVAMTIGTLLSSHVRAQRLGYVMGSEAGFVLTRDPDTVLAPDVSFVRRERVPQGVPETFFEGAPDLAVEVVSATDRLKDLREKASRFLRHCAQLVWIVDPRRRSVEVWSAQHDGLPLEGAQTIDGGGAIPGFQCAVSKFFEDLDLEKP